jgi:uncharacterized protein with PQ loop repeat
VLLTLNIMLSGSVAILAGTVSTVLFALSTLPMLIKAARTKDLASYSRGNMVLANVGNAVHSIYVFQLPAGPIWVLHGFYLVSSALMLFWHLRYARRPARTAARPTSPAQDPWRVASEREAGIEHRQGPATRSGGGRTPQLAASVRTPAAGG